MSKRKRVPGEFDTPIWWHDIPTGLMVRERVKHYIISDGLGVFVFARKDNEETMRAYAETVSRYKEFQAGSSA